MTGVMGNKLFSWSSWSQLRETNAMENKVTRTREHKKGLQDPYDLYLYSNTVPPFTYCGKLIFVIKPNATLKKLKQSMSC